MKTRCKKWNAEEHEFLVSNSLIMSLDEIAKHLRRSVSSVQRYAYRKDIPLQAKKCKFDDKTIKEVQLLLKKKNMTHKEIAAITGVSSSYVSQINTGRQRKSQRSKSVDTNKINDTLHLIFR